MFFFKKPVVHIDAFTNNVGAFKATPIIESYKSMPKWMDQVPRTKHSYSTEFGSIKNTSRRSVRTCPGFLDLYKRGFIIESWADFRIESNEKDYSYHYTNGPAPTTFVDDVNFHPGFKDYHLFKLSSPWLIESDDIPFVTFGTEWSLENVDARIIPGSINFNMNSNVNVFLAFKKQQATITIPIGEPLVQFVPLTEKKVKIHNHLISNEEMQRKIMPSSISFRGWRKTFSLVKRAEERAKIKCPFTSGHK